MLALDATLEGPVDVGPGPYHVEADVAGYAGGHDASSSPSPVLGHASVDVVGPAEVVVARCALGLETSPMSASKQTR